MNHLLYIEWILRQEPQNDILLATEQIVMLSDKSSSQRIIHSRARWILRQERQNDEVIFSVVLSEGDASLL